MITNSSEESQKEAFDLAKAIGDLAPINHAVVLALEGDLGSGKTTFLKGLAEGLGVKEKILSPSFVVFKRFNLTEGRFKNFYHFDCYRLKSINDLKPLGIDEILADPNNIVALEWSSVVTDTLPSDAIVIKFEFIDETKRKIEILNIKK